MSKFHGWLHRVVIFCRGGAHPLGKCARCDRHRSEVLDDIREHYIAGFAHGLGRDLTTDELAEIDKRYCARRQAHENEEMGMGKTENNRADNGSVRLTDDEWKRRRGIELQHQQQAADFEWLGMLGRDNDR